MASGPRGLTSAPSGPPRAAIERIGFITGTGFYELPGLESAERRRQETPFGPVEVTTGSWHGGEVGFLPRHGDDHSVAPSKINYRANIWALAELGVRQLFTVAVVGSLLEEVGPGSVVLLDQFIDLTKGRRADTFFDQPGEVRHVDMTFPYSPRLRELVLEVGTADGIELVSSGTYACFEGPRFESAAEARMAAMLGAKVVGMTGYPEVVLARELDVEICTLAVVSNFAPGVVGNTVSVEEVVSATEAASKALFRLLGRSVELLAEPARKGS